MEESGIDKPQELEFSNSDVFDDDSLNQPYEFNVGNNLPTPFPMYPFHPSMRLNPSYSQGDFNCMAYPDLGVDGQVNPSWYNRYPYFLPPRYPAGMLEPERTSLNLPTPISTADPEDVCGERLIKSVTEKMSPSIKKKCLIRTPESCIVPTREVSLVQHTSEEPCEGASADNKPNKKTTPSSIKLTQEQTNGLEEKFNTTQYPTKDEKNTWSEELGLPVTRITTWFANRRSRSKRSAKRKALLEKSTNSGCTSTENCRDVVENIAESDLMKPSVPTKRKTTPRKKSSETKTEFTKVKELPPSDLLNRHKVSQVLPRDENDNIV